MIVRALDGGQILYACLWFLIGRAPALQAASLIGLVAGIGLAGLGLLVPAAPLLHLHLSAQAGGSGG